MRKTPTILLAALLLAVMLPARLSPAHAPRYLVLHHARLHR